MLKVLKHEMEHRNSALIIARGSKKNLSVLENITKILRILSHLHEDIYLISCYDKSIRLNLKEHNIYKLIDYKNKYADYILRQASLINHIIKLRYKYNIIYFVLGQDLLLMPILFSKILGKKIVIRSDGRPSTIVRRYIGKRSKIKIIFFYLVEKINYSVADILMTECEYMIEDNNFGIYLHPCVGNLYIDNQKFYKIIDLSARPYDIGYIGRFHPQKGVNELMTAIPNIIQRKSDIKIFIGGDGELKEEIYILKNNSRYSQVICLNEWISHNQLPNYLNKIKLLILPSYKEGLPNIILEAMACGTAVLATPVGGIPGVIQDGKTGFIMENNSPECIAENVKRALACPELEEIAEAGRRFVEENYSFEKTVERWKGILRDIE